MNNKEDLIIIEGEETLTKGKITINLD